MSEWGDNKYRDALERVAKSLLVDPRIQMKFDFEDLVNETLLRAVAAQPDALPDRSDGERFSFLFQIVRNLLSDLHTKYLDSQKRDVRHEVREEQLRGFNRAVEDSVGGLGNLIASGYTSPSQQAMKQEENARLTVAIEQLPERQRTAILLYREGLSTAEIAEKMETTVVVVGSLIHRAIENLKKLANS